MSFRILSAGLTVSLATVLVACSDDESNGDGNGAGGTSSEEAGADGSGGVPSNGGSGGGTATGGGSATGGATGTGGGDGADGGGSGGSSGGGSGGSSGGTTADSGSGNASFFVSSDTSDTGDLGGILGADARCQSLADAAGLGDKTWHAYLSADGNPRVNARDRIGTGPWYNVLGVLVAEDLDSLHARAGDADVFVDENGEKINGQWAGSPAPNQHDILTGSDADGNLLEGLSCDGWTSSSPDQAAQIGHSDGLGPDMNGDPPFSSWQSSHANQSCANTAPRGGAGKIYCFAID